MSDQRNEQRGFSQIDAAHYMGIGVTFFREHVHVEPVPAGPVVPGKRPKLIYLREELDAVLDQWKAQRLPVRRAS